MKNFDVLTKASNLLHIVKTTNSTSDKVKAVKELWNLSHSSDENKELLCCSRELAFLPTIKILLQTTNNPNDDLFYHATGCLWYLSRNRAAGLEIASRELQLFPLLLSSLRKGASRSQEHMENALSNCSRYEETHNYLLSPELGFLEYWKEQLLERSDDNVVYWDISPLVVNMTENKYIHQVYQSTIPLLILRKLLSYGSNPQKWDQSSRERIICHCLHFISYFCQTSLGANLTKDLLETNNASNFFLHLLSFDGYAERIQATIIVANLYGREEENQNEGRIITSALLETHQNLLPFLLDIFDVTLNYNEKRKIVQSLKEKGFRFGKPDLKQLSAALKNLSISDANQQIMIKSIRLFEIIGSMIQLFVEDQPPCSGADYRGVIQFAGGGGKDIRTLENLLEVLLHLSFCFINNEHQFHAICNPPFSNLQKLLLAFIHLPDSRPISHEAKQSVTTLLQKLQLKSTEPSLISESNASDSQHIMLSYSWASQKGYVVALGKKLREEYGYDVWRDEEGSAIVPSMSGDMTDRMAEAIQRSYLVVIFVSPEYKESANCRAEANYSKQREKHGQLRIAYVMLNKEYHTQSRRPVDGWLGFMIGSDRWYPLWEESHLQSSAKDLADLIGNNAKLASNLSILKTLPPPINNSIKSVQTRTNSIDYLTAWSCLQPKKSLCPNGLPSVLEDLGITEAKDLIDTDRKILEALASLLKPVPEATFRQALQLLTKP